MFKGGNKRSADTLPGRRREGPKTQERPTPADLSQRYAFRRNRTLTGSSSAQVVSSNELNAELRSPRAHVHHLTSLRRRLLVSFGGVGMVALGLYILLSQLVAGMSVQLSGIGVPSQADQKAYTEAIDRYYAARPAERLRFLLNEKDLLAHVQSERPEIKAVDIVPGAQLGQAAVTLKVRMPIAHWSINGSDQYVDEQGVVFARNYYANPTLQIVDNSGVQTSSNKLVASNRFLGFVGRVIAGSNNSGLSVSKVTIPALTTRQVTLNLAGKATYYKLSVDRSAGQQVEDIVRVDRYLQRKNIKPEYADVRLQGKSFYK